MNWCFYFNLSSDLIFPSLFYQSGTKPNLLAKILATNFGVFLAATKQL